MTDRTDTPRKRRRWPRRLAITVLVILALPVFLWGLAQTPWSKARIANWLSTRVSTASGYTVDFKGLHGILPGEIRVDSITVADADGTWLQAADVAIELDLRALIDDRRIHLPSATVGSLDWQRQPGPAGPTPPPADSLPWLDVDALAIHHLTVGEAVAGQAIDGRLSGDLQTRGDHADGVLKLRLADDTVALDTTVSVIRGSDLATTQVVLDLDLQESQTLLFERLGIPFSQQGRLQIAVDGPIAELPVVVTLTVDGQEIVSAKGTVKPLAAEPGIDLQGTVLQPANLPLPAALLERLVGPVALAITARQTTDGTLVVDSFSLRDEVNTVTGSGEYVPDSQQVALRAEAAVTSLPALKLPVALSADGTLALTLQATGSPDRLQADITLAAPSLRYGEWQATEPRLHAQIETTDTAWRGDGLPTATIDVSLTSSRLAGPAKVLPEPLVSLSTSSQFQLSPEGLTSDQFALTTERVAATVHAFRWQREAQQISAKVSAEVADITELRPWTQQDVRGAVTVDSTLTLALETLAVAANGRATWSGAGFAEYDVAAQLGSPLSSDFTVTYDPTDGRLTLAETTLKSALIDGTISGNGIPVERTLTVVADLRHRDLSQLRLPGELTLAGDWRVTSTFTITPELLTGRYTWEATESRVADWSATAQQGKGHFTLATPYAAEVGPLSLVADGHLAGLAGPGLERVPVTDGDVRVELDRATDGILTVKSLQIKDGELQLDASGEVNPESMRGDVTGRLQVPALERFASLVGDGMSGALTLDIEAHGDLAKPRLKGRLRSESLTVSGQTVTAVDVTSTLDRDGANWAGETTAAATWQQRPATVSGHWVLQPDALLVDDLDVAASETTVTGDLRVTLSSRLATASLRGSSADLSVWQEFIPVPVTGGAEFNLQLQPADAKQDATIDLTLGEASIADLAMKSATVKAALHDLLGTPDVDGTVTLTDATYDDTHVSQLTLSAKGSQDDLQFAISAAGQHAEREFVIDEATGRLQGTTLELMTLAGTGFGYPLLLLEPTRLSWTDGMSLSTSRLRVGRGELTASGTLVGEVLTLDVKTADLPLDALPGVTSQQLTGTASATLSLRGTLAQPTGKASVRLKDLRVLGDDNFALFTGGADLQATLRDGGVSVSAALYEADYQPFQMEGELPLHLSLSPFVATVDRNAPIRLEADLDVELGTPARYLLPEGHFVHGNARGHLVVTGSLATPRLDGQLRWHEGSYENVYTGTVVKDVTMSLTGTGNRLEVSEFRGSDGGSGQIVGSGHWLFDPDKHFPFSATATLDRFTAVRYDHTTAETAGEITVAGDLTAMAVTGKLEVTGAEIRMPETKERIVFVDVIETQDGEPIVTPESAESAPGAMPVSLDLNASSRGRIFLRGNGIDSEWRGDLVIHGDAAMPAVTGELSLVRGIYTFGGRRFKLVQGSLRFDGATPPDPVLRLVADTQTDELLVSIIISGSTSAPKLAVTSRPSLPTEEILAQLFFRQGAGQISPYQALSLAALAEKITTGGDAFDIAAQLRRVTTLDQVDFAPSETPGGSGSVSAGKYIGDRFYLEYTKSFDADEDRISVEIELRKNLGLETDVSPSGAAGAGIFWRKDY